MHAHTQTDRQTDRQIDRQTGRQTDRQTDAHTHISNHLPEPSPSVEVQSCVCETSDPAWGRIKEKARDQAANAQSNIHACLYLPTHSIPKIKAQLPTSYNGRHTDTISFLCAWSLHSPSPNYQSSHPHVFKYLSLFTISSLWPPDLPLCAPGREGR